MDDPALQALFLEESRENLSQLSDSLLTLEKSPDDRAAIDTAFRAAHTIKGSARLMQRDHVADLAHQLEDVLAAWRAGRLRPGPGIVSSLFQSLDRLEELITGREPATAGASAAPVASAETIRLPARRVDRLVGTVEDLWVGRVREREMFRDLTDAIDRLATLERAAPAPANAAPGASEATARARRDIVARLVGLRNCLGAAQATGDAALDELLAEAAQLRTIPLAVATGGLAREVRDLATSQGKAVELDVEGDDLELDKIVLEAIADPLLHLVRNAVDHGIESPPERATLGKPAAGRIAIRADIRDERAIVEVADDGRGIDPARLVESARRKGLVGPTERLTDDQALELIFTLGFSTRDVATDVSGRGVGMDIVRTRVAAAHGAVRVRSAPGRGTTFELELPLSLGRVRSLIVSAGGRVLAVPLAAVSAVDAAAGANPAGAVRLSDLLDLPPDEASAIIVLEAAGRRTPLLVGRVLAADTLLVRPLGPLFRSAGVFDTGAVLDDGTTVLLAQPDELARLVPHSTTADSPPTA